MSGDVIAQAPLVQHFDLIAQAPGGVARLRELILTLTVQGKLVPQNPSDEPASELLKKIRAEKDRLITEDKIKRDKPLAEIADEEKSFELPESWLWVPLQHIGYTQTGTTPDKKNPHMYGGDIPFIKPGDIYPNYVDYSNEALSDAGLADSGRLAPAGSLLMVCIGTIGKSNLIERECSFNQQINAVTPLCCSPEYIKLFCRSPFFRGEAWARSSSTTISILNKGKWEAIPMALPPLAEQSRIVTRVEELMQLCDALEASGQLEAQQHAQLASTLLGTLTQSETPEALADNWQRIATHFDLLLDRPEAVDALEQTILQLAVRGLLVPQDPTDEPASVLLQKIRTEKDHLIAQGQIKRDKPLPSVADDEVLFELPLSWEWARLGNFCKVISGYAFSSEDLSCESGIRAIKITNAGVGEFYETDDYLPISFASGFENFKAEKDDLILSLTRPYIASGLKVSRCPPSYEGALINQRVAAIRPVSAISSDFVFAYMCSRDVLTIYQNRFNGSGLQPNLKVSDVTELVMPLPPLSEQFRIVTRVNELRSLCADLRRQIVNAHAVMENLSKSLVA